MIKRTLLLASALMGLAGGDWTTAWAQPVAPAERSGAPSGFVPGRNQPTETSTGSAEARPGARNQPNGQVAPPSKIDTPVQIIAPEKKP